MPQDFHPLSDGELSELGAVLARVQGGQIGNIEALDGFCAALACCPDLVMPSEFLPVVQAGATEAGDLGEDCILVCPSTDPSWTALFTRITGLVVERGSMLSHSAIVAREMGIPAVVGVQGATSAVNTGDRLRLDGAAGHVQILQHK